MSATSSFPVLHVAVSDIVVNSNIAEFVEAARQYAESINLKPETDEDFALAADDIKDCELRETLIKEKRLEFIKETGVIAEILAAFNESEKLVSDARKALEKAVKDRREAIKRDAIAAASEKIRNATLEAEKTIKPIQLDMVFPALDSIVKGKRTIETMHKAIDQHVADCIAKINAKAAFIQKHLEYLRTHAAGLSHLFPDLQRIVNRDTEVFIETVASRLEQHNQAIELQRKKDEEPKASQNEPEAPAQPEPTEVRQPVDEPVEQQPAAAEAQLVPPVLDKPVISHDGDTWHVLSVGNTNEHGMVFCHLSSTTRARQQANGVNPVQIGAWINPSVLSGGNDPSDDEIVEAIMQSFDINRLSAIELLLSIDLERLSAELLASY